MLEDNEHAKTLPAKALGKIRKDLKVIAKAFSDVLNENPDSSAIQLGVIYSLQKLNVASEDSISALIKAVSNENDTVKSWAKEALIAFGDSAIPELIKEFNNIKDKKDLETYRANIVFIMGEIAGQSKDKKVRAEVKEIIKHFST